MPNSVEGGSKKKKKQACETNLRPDGNCKSHQSSTSALLPRRKYSTVVVLTPLDCQQHVQSSGAAEAETKGHRFDPCVQSMCP